MTNSVVYDTLTPTLNSCIEHFTNNSHSSTAMAILLALRKIEKDLKFVKPIAFEYIAKHVHRYDIVPGLEANGYRSLLEILNALLLNIIGELRKLLAGCKDTFFRGNRHAEILQMYANLLHQQRALLYYAQQLIKMTPNGELFVNEEQSELIMHDCELMAKSCFYGSLHGFQYFGAIQPLLQSLSLFVASYDDLHRHEQIGWKSIKSAINSSRYVLSPEIRAEKLEKVYNSANVQFFKKFWSLNESGVLKSFPNFIGTTIQVHRVFEIPTDPFYIHNKDETDEIKICFSTCKEDDPKPISARLYSATLREGQESIASPSYADKGLDKSKFGFGSVIPQPPSKNLIFFCHGGGFISLTSKSYEFILRQWSSKLDCPIFSVDYSLAPESPFPQGFEECFFAYVWAVKNAHLLGVTLEKIVFVGDSAGGNLVLSVAMRAATYGIRVPDSIVVAYPACVVRYSASPARLMSVMDPLLPLGVLSSCLSAYLGTKSDKIKRSASVGDSNNSRPTSPSRQTVRVAAFQNLVKDVGEGLSRMTTSMATTKSPGEDKTWWDDEFEVLDDHTDCVSSPSTSHEHAAQSSFPRSQSEIIGNLDKNTTKLDSKNCDVGSTTFQCQLPHHFQPIKSKFYGDYLKMHHTSLGKNAYISPALAPDELIKGLPYVDILGCEFDPLFDDSVVLAKRLQALNKEYKFHVVKGLPHGFLNFLVCKETKDAAQHCMSLIQQAFDK